MEPDRATRSWNDVDRSEAGADGQCRHRERAGRRDSRHGRRRVATCTQPGPPSPRRVPIAAHDGTSTSTGPGADRGDAGRWRRLDPRAGLQRGGDDVPWQLVLVDRGDPDRGRGRLPLEHRPRFDAQRAGDAGPWAVHLAPGGEGEERRPDHGEIGAAAHGGGNAQTRATVTARKWAWVGRHAPEASVVTAPGAGRWDRHHRSTSRTIDAPLTSRSHSSGRTVTRCARAATATALTSSGTTKSRPDNAVARATAAVPATRGGGADACRCRRGLGGELDAVARDRPTVDGLAPVCMASRPAAIHDRSTDCSSRRRDAPGEDVALLGRRRVADRQRGP